jgi:putative transposase
MRTSYYRLFARQVQEQTVTLLLGHLRPPDYSTLCSAWVLLSSLVLAAASGVSLAAIAVLRPGSPSRETLRQALWSTLPQYVELRQRVAALLVASLPRRLRQRRPGRRYPLAIDLHGVAYYKRQAALPTHVRRGKRFPGTTYGHLYATASLLRKGQYYVVALTPYDPGESMAAVVRRLLQQASRNGFPPRYVLMDRSFWSADVFRYLQRARYPFLIPVLARGKKPSKGGPTGTQVFLHARPTGWYTYRVANPQKQTAQVTIVVHRHNHNGWRGKHGRYAWAYAMWRMDFSSIAWVRQSYRRRFRIESSYRLLEAARGRTSSRDEGWRLWYVVLAVLLLNAWLELRRVASRNDQCAGSEWQWWNRLLIALIYVLLLEPGRQAPHGTLIQDPQQK